MLQQAWASLRRWGTGGSVVRVPRGGGCGRACGGSEAVQGVRVLRKCKQVPVRCVMLAHAAAKAHAPRAAAVPRRSRCQAARSSRGVCAQRASVQKARGVGMSCAAPSANRSDAHVRVEERQQAANQVGGNEEQLLVPPACQQR